MKVELLSIGDELLIGQVVNTNAAYLAQALNKIGLEVSYISVCADTKEAIIEALTTAHLRANLLLVTGGLGPTKDDVTKESLCAFYDDRLEENPEVLAHIEFLFATYIQTPIRPANRTQALLPTKAEVLKNEVGTASAMWFTHKGVHAVFMPGVPREMQHLMESQVLARLKSMSSLIIRHRTLMTYGLGESAIAERIEAIEEQLPPELSLSYLPNFGRVRLRLTAKDRSEALVAHGLTHYGDLIAAQLSDIYFGEEEDGNLASQVLKAAKRSNMTIASCESCTGGSIASAFTEIAGASAVFAAALVPYQTHQKSALLGIDVALIENHSVVSAPVAEAMAL
ncbi:MAG: CinA family nicotinamide mononucleotide deamidase-related protein, partial [Flavobacteriaceae bacterium]